MILTLDHVLMFVPSVRAAAEWYSSVLDVPSSFRENFAIISVGGAQLCFHPANAKVPSCHAGQVAYWRVVTLADAMRRLESAGATLYRGPLAIESGQGICQFADPFGNLFGLIGAYNDA